MGIKQIKTQLFTQVPVICVGKNLRAFVGRVVIR